MDNGRQQRVPNFCDEHDTLDQEDKESYNGDHYVKIGNTICFKHWSAECLSLKSEGNLQLAPWKRRMNGPVVGIGVYDFIGIAVPSMI